VGNYIPLFQTMFEKVYVWTYMKNTDSALVSEVDEKIKEQPFWKNIATVIGMVFALCESFESSFTEELDYEWMYYFEQGVSTIEDIVFNNLSDMESHCMSYGRHVKATEIANMADVIELVMRDDKAYTALSLLDCSFKIHFCCLICELGQNPYVDHLSHEPQFWEQGILLPKMEAATVQACRCVESILGEPPSRKNQNAILRHKEKWLNLTGIDPDISYDKAGMKYFDFYYELFFDLRNSSAHSYGNIHFDLERKKVVEAQCFAVIILNSYFKKNMISVIDAQAKLKFNEKLLERVSEEMSTKMTM